MKRLTVIASMLIFVILLLCAPVALSEDYSYEAWLYDQDFSNCTTLADAGITGDTANWSIQTNGEGKKYLKGNAGKDKQIILGNEDWEDCTIEMNFKININEDLISTEHFGIRVLPRYLPTSPYAEYFEYYIKKVPSTITNWNKYNFMGYVRSYSSSTATIQSVDGGTNNFQIQNDAIAPIPNQPQKLKIELKNVGETASGVSIQQTIYLNDALIASGKYWTSNLNFKRGKVAIRNYSDTANYEIYNIKVTGKRKIDLSFTGQDGTTSLNGSIPLSSNINVTGNIARFITPPADGPVVISTLHDGNKMIDVDMEKVNFDDGAISKTFYLTLNTPQQAENLYARAFVWENLNTMKPIFEGNSVGTVPNAAVSEGVGMYIDPFGTIQIHGKTQNAGSTVTVLVFNPLRGMESIDFSNKASIKSALAYVGQVTADEAGNYDFECKAIGNGQEVCGTYTAVVSENGGANIYTLTKNYIDMNTLKDAIDEVNQSTLTNIEEIKQFIDDRAEILSLDLSLLDPLKDTSSVYRRIFANRPYLYDEAAVNNNEMIRLFKEAVLLQRFYECDAAEMESLITNNLTTFMIDQTKRYPIFNGEFDDSEKLKIYQTLAGDTTSAEDLSISKIAALFDSSVFMQLITGRVFNWKGMEKNLKDNNDLLNIDFTDYDSLSEANKVSLFAEFNQLALKTPADVKSNFDRLVKKYKSTNTSGSSKNNTRSTANGASGTNISMTPVQPEIKPILDTLVSKKFSDLQGFAWAKDAVEYLADKEIIQGYEGKFNPGNKVLREEFVKMMVEALQLLNTGARSKFSDVAPEEWYYPYIASAEELELINGSGEGIFGVGREITRQELVTMAYRFAEYANIPVKDSVKAESFCDESDIADYAKKSVEAMQKAGIVSGVGDGRFAPNQTASRAEAAVIIYKLLMLV